MASLNVTWRQALAWRLERQFVDPPADASAAEIVSRLCGVQAQVASSADLAVRVRQRDPGSNEVQDALHDGRVVKTWAMRGALHLLPAGEAGVYLALLAAGRSWETPAWERYFGLSPSDIERLRDVVRGILDGRVLTREELNAEIVRQPGLGHLGEELKSGWGTLFKPLAWQGDIVFGPNRGTRVTFARPEQISPFWRPLPRAEEAAPAAIAGYLRAYGPATPTHVRSWLSRGRISGKRLKHWFAASGSGLASVDVDGEEMFVRACDLDSLATSKPSESVTLLPGFDQWVLGPGTDDTHVIPARRRPLISRTAGWISPIVVVGGVVSGTWSFEQAGVSVQWFQELGRVPTSALEAAVEHLALLVDRRLELSVAILAL